VNLQFDISYKASSLLRWPLHAPNDARAESSLKGIHAKKHCSFVGVLLYEMDALSVTRSRIMCSNAYRERSLIRPPQLLRKRTIWVCAQGPTRAAACPSIWVAMSENWSRPFASKRVRT